MLPSRRVPASARAAYRLDRKASWLAGIYSGAIYPFTGVLARDVLHASALELSWMSSAPYIGSLLAIFYARAIDGRRKVRSMVGPFMICRIILFCMLFAHSSTTFVILLAASQIVAGLAGPATAAVLKEIYPDDSRGRIMSYNRVALTLSAALVALPAGWLLKQQAVGFRVVFPIAAVIGMVGSLTYLRIEALYAEQWAALEAAATRKRRRSLAALRQWIGETTCFLRDTFAIFRTDRNYCWYAFSVFTYGFGTMMLSPLYPIFQVDRLQITTAQIGALAQISQVTMIFSYFYWGRYVDLTSPLRAVVINMLLNAGIPLVYFFSGSVWHLIPAFILVGVVNAGIDLSYFNSILTFANEENVSRYQALHSFMLGIRGTTGPFAGIGLMHLLENHGLDLKYLFLICMLIILAGCWMQVIGMRSRYDKRRGASAAG